MSNTAESPGDGKAYHLLTAERDLNPFGLFVGAQGRAELFQQHFLTSVIPFINDERGLKAFSGLYKDLPVSIVTSNMGPAQMEITLFEAIKSGLRVPIRVGSSGLLIPGSKPGEPIIVKGAMRRDGQEILAPLGYPALADFEVVSALNEAAAKIVKGIYHIGLEVTTNSFYLGQGRRDLFGRLLPMVAYLFEEAKLYGHCFSMEAATEFVICLMAGLPAGAINVGYGNRITDEWLVSHEQKVAAELQAGEVALEALYMLAQKPSMQQYASGQHVLSLDSLLDRVTQRAK